MAQVVTEDRRRAELTIPSNKTMERILHAGDSPGAITL